MATSVYVGTGGNVTGPVSATDGVPALFDGTTGQLIKNSSPTGSGVPVLATTPTLVTPVLGAATGTSVNLSGDCRAATYHVGATAGASGTGTTLTALTVVNGLVTAITIS